MNRNIFNNIKTNKKSNQMHEKNLGFKLIKLV